MPARPCPPHLRRTVALLLASGIASTFSTSSLLAQVTTTPIVLVDIGGTPPAPADAAPTTTAPTPAPVPSNTGIELLAPQNVLPPTEQDVDAENSTLEMHIARRPWLLEKLTKPKTEPSVKMNPPKPPHELPDPPSMNRLAPRVATPLVPPKTSDRSVGNGNKPTYADVPLRKDDPVAKPVVVSPAPKRLAASEAQKAEPKLDVDPVPEETVPSPSDVATAPSADPPKLDSVESEQISIRRPTIDRDGTKLTETVKEAKQPAKPAVGHVEDIDPITATPVPAPKLDYAGYPEQPIRLTNSTYRMRNMIAQTLRYHYARPEIANERSNWGMMHSIMVYGIDTKVLVGRKKYSAIAWIAGNNACRGQRILTDEPGRLSARSGVGLQGHQAQLLAILSLSNVPMDYPLYAGENQYTVEDLIESEQLACKSGEELTFTLIGLSHYLDTDAVWRDERGETWDFERLLQEEMKQPIVGAACGGTHRLMAYAHALRKRRAEGKPIDGQWKRAEIYTQDFIKYVYQLQNRDGSISTDWFEGREDNGKMDRKIQTTGHMVEWLLTITPNSQLQNPRLVSAVRYLATSMYKEADHDWKIGPKGHALRSLAMFYERVYQAGTPWQSRAVAQRQSVRRR